MTDEQKKAYIESKGTTCPFCGGSLSLEDNDLNDDGSRYEIKSCAGCGMVFDERHDMVDVSVVEVEE